MQKLRSALAALVVAAALPSSAFAADGTIAFHQHAFDDSSSDVWLAAADGTTGAVQLTSSALAPDPDGCFEACGTGMPDWAPDGSRVFFDSSWAPFVHIWSIKPDGTDARQETFSTGFECCPSVSPDGSMLAYEYDDPDDFSLGGIYVTPIGGGTPVQLTVSPKRGFDTSPAYSPDGKQLVFQRIQFRQCPPKGCGGRGETGFTSAIWAVGTDGSGLHMVLPGGRVWGEPHYSPDGSRILTSSYWENRGRSRGTGSSLYTARPDGSDLTQLTSHKDEVSFSSDWSPDGSRIVFVHYQFGDDHLQIRTIAADGSDPETVADCDPNLFCANPRWGVYDGPLPAATIARASTRVSASAAGHRAHRRLRRAIRRELSGRSRGAWRTALRTGR